MPQISEHTEELLHLDGHTRNSIEDSTARILVPLAYPFPHIGKILAFLFISFAAWYVGDDLGSIATAEMAATGVVSSFASPLVSIPYMLDKFQLPQDLMALSVIVAAVLQGRLRLRLARLAGSMVVMGVCLLITCSAGRWYLASTKLDCTCDDQFLALGISQPHDDVIVYESRDELPPRSLSGDPMLENLASAKVLRVGYRARHLPYSYFNRRNELVVFDVELMHQLAAR